MTSGASDPGFQDEAALIRLASSADAPAALLSSLAGDSRVQVRVAVALNPATPHQLEARLARDDDERIRALLGRKLALLLPALDEGVQSVLAGHVLGTLGQLAEDSSVQVRAAIADIVKAMPEAPRVLILRLAADAASLVSEPVLRLSPVLSDRDLISLIIRPPHPQAIAAIAHRSNLSENVSDALVASAREDAITTLLRNPSAAIREATLDAIVNEAAAHELWHLPLACRSDLTPALARKIAEFIKLELLELLAGRPDLPQETLATVQASLRQRQPAKPTPQAAQDCRLPSEAVLLEASRHGDIGRCKRLLAHAARVPVAVVEQAVAYRSAKGLVSLVWAAGFSMRVAVDLQVLVGRIHPAFALRPAGGDTFPLTQAEMQWQLAMLQRLAAEAARERDVRSSSIA